MENNSGDSRVRSHSKIPFNRPFIIGRELEYIAEAVESGHLAGDGAFTRRCQEWMEQRFGARKALLTHSCTAALEMAAILADIGPGDQVVLPSFTFVSTANAFVMRGATPVWCEIREDTLNLDENRLEELITPRTRAIVPVHYAGVGCEMVSIMNVAEKHGLLVIEDAAQAVNASYGDRWLGTIGHFGCFSFHETKSMISGEGGALLVNDPRFMERAEIVREKGTNRTRFFQGKIDKYTWVDYGSSYLPSELVAAFLCAQLEETDLIHRKRLMTWNTYAEGLRALADAGRFRLPSVPPECGHNGHMFYIMLASEEERGSLIDHLKALNIMAVFHYVPLHKTPMGMKLQPCVPSLPVTERVSSGLLRLPMYHGLSREQQQRVIDGVHGFFN